MTDQNIFPHHIFKIGATTIVADETTAAMDNEQARQFFQATYPEVAHATIREQPLDDGTVVVTYLPRPGRKG